MLISVLIFAVVGLWCTTCFAILSITLVFVGVSRWLSTKKRTALKTVENPVDNWKRPCVEDLRRAAAGAGEN